MISPKQKKRRQSGEQRVVVQRGSHCESSRNTLIVTFSAIKRRTRPRAKGAEVISMAEKIKDQKEQSILGENSAECVGCTFCAFRNNSEKAPNSTVEQKNDSDDDGLAQNNLEYGHQPIFPVFEARGLMPEQPHASREFYGRKLVEAFIQQLNAAPQLNNRLC